VIHAHSFRDDRLSAYKMIGSKSSTAVHINDSRYLDPPAEPNVMFEEIVDISRLDMSNGEFVFSQKPQFIVSICICLCIFQATI
jgi:hypothetical protein